MTSYPTRNWCGVSADTSVYWWCLARKIAADNGYDLNDERHRVLTIKTTLHKRGANISKHVMGHNGILSDTCDEALQAGVITEKELVALFMLALA